MRKIKSLLLFIICTIGVNAQHLIRTLSYDETKKPTNKNEYKYNFEGKRMEEISYDWNRETLSYIPNTKIEKKYENNQLKSFTYFTWSLEEAVWEIVINYDSFYEENTCLTKQIQTWWYPSGEIYSIDTLIIENQYSCSDAWKYEHYWLAIRWVEADKVKRIRTDSSELQIFEFHNGSNVFETGRQERFYNEQNQLVKYFNSYTDYQYAHLYLNEYNHENGKIEKSEYFYKITPDEPWRKKSETRWAYFYDEGALTQRRMRFEEYEGYHITSTWLSILNYEYYCDGLLKKVNWVDEDGAPGAYTLYEYDVPTECEEEENLTLNVFPNPFTGKVIIESNLLNQKGAIVNLYDASGKLLFKNKIEDRLNQFELDLTVYGEQFFVLQIQTESKQISTKLIGLN